MLEARKEYKFIFSNYELEKFKMFLNSKENKLFNDRIITSLYMDTSDFKLYKLSIENDVDKYKVRFRQYNNEGGIFQEIKLNTQEGKQKIINKKNNFKNLDDINQIRYKNLDLVPAIKISYKRSYFNFRNVRITIDKNLQFESTKNHSMSKNKLMSKFNIVEYKILHQQKPDIESSFFQNPVSFSKYNYGIENLYNLKPTIFVM